MVHVNTHNFQLRSLEEVLEMAQLLSSHFPDPQQSKVGIYELLINAVEHGNLGIGYDAKAALLQKGEWQEEIRRRLTMPEYAHKEVDIKLIRDENTCCLTIADQGAGFDWRRHMHTISSGKRPNGRGLLIATNCNFDRISFNPAGNVVTCLSRYMK